MEQLIVFLFRLFLFISGNVLYFSVFLLLIKMEMKCRNEIHEMETKSEKKGNFIEHIIKHYELHLTIYI